MRIVNARTNQAIATAVEMADTRATRRRGLLGRDRLDPGAGLMLAPCFMIHTAFMRFPIDVVFLDRYGFVIRVVRSLPAWRMAVAPGARMTLELPSGAVGNCDVRVGDHLYLVPPATARAVTAA